MTIMRAERPLSSSVPATPVTPLQHAEGAAIAAATMAVLVLAGFSSWWPLALFLVFDLSMIGYAISVRIGALGYNLVHNYAAPAALAAVCSILITVGHPMPALAIIAASWIFHVGVDRALGYGPRPTS